MKKLMLSIIALACCQEARRFPNYPPRHNRHLARRIKTIRRQDQELRTVIKISTTDNDKLAAVLYSIDQRRRRYPATTFTRKVPPCKDDHYRLERDLRRKDELDGNTIDGTWSQGGPLQSPDPDESHPRDCMGHSRTPSSAETDGGRCETGIRSRHDQAKRSDQTGLFSLPVIRGQAC